MITRDLFPASPLIFFLANHQILADSLLTFSLAKAPMALPWLTSETSKSYRNRKENEQQIRSARFNNYERRFHGTDEPAPAYKCLKQLHSGGELCPDTRPYKLTCRLNIRNSAKQSTFPRYSSTTTTINARIRRIPYTDVAANVIALIRAANVTHPRESEFPMHRHSITLAAKWFCTPINIPHPKICTNEER